MDIREVQSYELASVPIVLAIPMVRFAKNVLLSILEEDEVVESRLPKRRGIPVAHIIDGMALVQPTKSSGAATFGALATNHFDPSSATAFDEIHKSSEAKLVFPDITVRQTEQLIESIPSGKAIGVDGKLQIYGLEETSLLRSYRSNRKQRTVIGNVYSSSQSLTHGVP
ncbi:hypothetical protein ACROYT_G025663 [Oculina patagonica]